MHAVPYQLTTLTGWQGPNKACGGAGLFCIAQSLFLSMGPPSLSSGLRQECIAQLTFISLPLISTTEQETRGFQAFSQSQVSLQVHPPRCLVPCAVKHRYAGLLLIKKALAFAVSACRPSWAAELWSYPQMTTSMHPSRCDLVQDVLLREERSVRFRLGSDRNFPSRTVHLLCRELK